MQYMPEQIVSHPQHGVGCAGFIDGRPCVVVFGVSSGGAYYTTFEDFTGWQVLPLAPAGSVVVSVEGTSAETFTGPWMDALPESTRQLIERVGIAAQLAEDDGRLVTQRGKYARP